jgi:hypothetical protein
MNSKSVNTGPLQKCRLYFIIHHESEPTQVEVDAARDEKQQTTCEIKPDSICIARALSVGS